MVVSVDVGLEGVDGPEEPAGAQGALELGVVVEVAVLEVPPDLVLRRALQGLLAEAADHVVVTVFNLILYIFCLLWGNFIKEEMALEDLRYYI